MATRTGYVGTQVAGDVLTAANFTKLPNGWIGYVEKTANQTGISTDTDITSLTVAPTVGSSRRLRITAQVNFKVSTPGATVFLRIKEDGTQVQESSCQSNDGIDSLTAVAVAVRAPSSGAHTYKLSCLVETGTVDVIASATAPGILIVEDMGPSA